MMAYPDSSSSSGGGPSTACPYSGHASLRHSQWCSAPPSASLAGWSQVGQRGGSAGTGGFYRLGGPPRVESELKAPA